MSVGAAAPALAAVRVEDVLVRRGGRTILDVPRLELPAGRTTVLFGPNGAGKTTLLRLIAALDRPDAGVVTVDGADRNGRGSVAYAFQEAVFLRGTVRANLALGLALRHVPSAMAAARLEAAAGECGILHLLEREARTLSGGEAQRANLARALALRAPITLLDEPLAGFDRVGRLRFLDELGQVLRGLPGTVVLVTHDRDEALRLADHMVLVIAGRVRAALPLASLLAHPPDRETAELLGYTVLPHPGVMGMAAGAVEIGVASAALRLGEGACSFSLVVERLVRVGLEDRIAGRIGEGPYATSVEVPLPTGVAAPVSGQIMTVAAECWVPVGGE